MRRTPRDGNRGRPVSAAGQRRETVRAGDLRFLAPSHFEFWYKKVFGKPRR